MRADGKTLYLIRQISMLIGLWHEFDAVWDLVVLENSAGYDNVDCRPAGAYYLGQRNAVQLARHVDVREHDSHILPFLQDSNGPMRVLRLKDFEAAVSQEISNSHADKGFILNNEHGWTGMNWLHRSSNDQDFVSPEPNSARLPRFLLDAIDNRDIVQST